MTSRVLSEPSILAAVRFASRIWPFSSKVKYPTGDKVIQVGVSAPGSLDLLLGDAEIFILHLQLYLVHLELVNDSFKVPGGRLAGVRGFFRQQFFRSLAQTIPFLGSVLGFHLKVPYTNFRRKRRFVGLQTSFQCLPLPREREPEDNRIDMFTL